MYSLAASSGVPGSSISLAGADVPYGTCVSPTGPLDCTLNTHLSAVPLFASSVRRVWQQCTFNFAMLELNACSLNPVFPVYGVQRAQGSIFPLSYYNSTKTPVPGPRTSASPQTDRMILSMNTWADPKSSIASIFCLGQVPAKLVQELYIQDYESNPILLPLSPLPGSKQLHQKDMCYMQGGRLGGFNGELCMQSRYNTHTHTHEWSIRTYWTGFSRLQPAGWNWCWPDPSPRWKELAVSLGSFISSFPVTPKHCTSQSASGFHGPRRHCTWIFSGTRLASAIFGSDWEIRQKAPQRNSKLYSCQERDFW